MPQQQAAAPAQLPERHADGAVQSCLRPVARRRITATPRPRCEAFIQQFPNDQLAGNAQYWLGETYYVRKRYNDAATAFAFGYQKYPKSGKGADDLLKLGMSLGSLGQKQDACSAF